MKKNKKPRRNAMGGNPWYFLKEGVINIFLNGFMSFAAISIIAICILVVGCFTLTAHNAKYQIAKEVEKSEILIFIESEYLMSQISDDLASIGGKPITPEDILNGFREESLQDEDLDDTLDEKTLNDTMQEANLDEENDDEIFDDEENQEEKELTLEQLNYINEFLNSEKSSSDYEEIEKQILQVVDVLGVTFTSKEQALQNYKTELGSEAFILEGFENDNPLRDGYTVHLQSLEHVDLVTYGLNQIEGIAEVSSRNETYKALYNIEKGFNILSVVFLVAFGAISIFIISNTVKLAMFARREEIAIMKMIGAKNAFIKWPFIVEGLVLGFLASILAYFTTWIIYIETIEFAKTFIGFVEIIQFDTLAITVLYGYLVTGIVIGVSGSLFTIRKFLDV